MSDFFFNFEAVIIDTQILESSRPAKRCPLNSIKSPIKIVLKTGNTQNTNRNYQNIFKDAKNAIFAARELTNILIPSTKLIKRRHTHTTSNYRAHYFKLSLFNCDN